MLPSGLGFALALRSRTRLCDLPQEATFCGLDRSRAESSGVTVLWQRSRRKGSPTQSGNRARHSSSAAGFLHAT